MRNILGIFLILPLASLAGGCGSGDDDVRYVTARVQTRLGGPLEETRMAVRAAPVDPERVPAAEAVLQEGELVLGMVVDGQPVAYPIRYLALYEVINDRVGETSLAPTW